jgi:hypothetical protein
MVIRSISSVTKWKSSYSVNRKDSYIPSEILKGIDTKKNEISVWEVKGAEDINDIIVAIALNRDFVKGIHYVLLEEESLKNIEIDVKHEKGEAPGLTDYILEKHCNLLEIDYWRLAYYIEYIQKIVDKSGQINKSEKDVKALLLDYISKGKIDKDKMKEKLRADLFSD